MKTMSILRLHELFDRNPKSDILEWVGDCHDCKKEIKVSATPEEDGIHIEGGSVYEIKPEEFIVRCDDCFGKDSVLRNYQKCLVYSRVVGYLRPVDHWNEGKQAEFKDRKMFKNVFGETV